MVGARSRLSHGHDSRPGTLLQGVPGRTRSGHIGSRHAASADVSATEEPGRTLELIQVIWSPLVDLGGWESGHVGVVVDLLKLDRGPPAQRAVAALARRGSFLRPVVMRTVWTRVSSYVVPTAHVSRICCRCSERRSRVSPQFPNRRPNHRPKLPRLDRHLTP